MISFMGLMILEIMGMDLMFNKYCNQALVVMVKSLIMPWK